MKRRAQGLTLMSAGGILIGRGVRWEAINQRKVLSREKTNMVHILMANTVHFGCWEESGLREQGTQGDQRGGFRIFPEEIMVNSRNCEKCSHLGYVLKESQQDWPMDWMECVRKKSQGEPRVLV